MPTNIPPLGDDVTNSDKAIADVLNEYGHIITKWWNIGRHFCRFEARRNNDQYTPLLKKKLPLVLPLTNQNHILLLRSKLHILMPSH